jgi:hypothetical protein
VPVRRAGVRRPLHEALLGRNPAEREADLIDEANAAQARVRDVLVALPKIGSVKAGRILADCGITHLKTLSGVSERQRTD